MKFPIRFLALLTLLTVAIVGCKPQSSSPTPVDSQSQPQSQPARTAALRILSGSENKPLESILRDFSRKSGIPVEMVYKGSVDIMLELEQEVAPAFEAVWPASGVWLDLAGSRMVKHSQSITRSPVVLGIKASRARKLGLQPGEAITTRQLMSWVEKRDLNFLITNPTQSNSGAMAYLGFLHALHGKDEPLSASDLDDPALAQAIRALLKGTDRTSGSSGWLADLYMENTGLFNAMLNYEMTLIELNQKLEAAREEPLWVFYFSDGQAIADSPLAFVDYPGNARLQDFKALQDYLLSKPVQTQLAAMGRRTGFFAEGMPVAAFRPEWGLDAARLLQPFPLPAPDAIRKALGLFQTNFKKPSITAFVLDFSGSMEGAGERQLKNAMSLLLQEETANRYLLRTGVEDTTVFIPFDAKPRRSTVVVGNAPEQQAALLEALLQERAGGGTNIYSATALALDEIRKVGVMENYQVAVILMTDGKSEGSSADVFSRWESLQVPIFTIMFGEADPSQLEAIAKRTRARNFDGRKNLIGAFREAKGYN